LFWFLGHPEVYIVLLPALGISSEIIATNSRKPIFGYKAMIGSMLFIAILSFIVWAHHMFVTGMNPFLGSIFMLLTLIIAVPSAVKIFNYVTTLWRGNIRFTPGMLFSIGLVSFFLTGGITGIFLGNSAIDIQLHDTYFVVAHFHLVMGSASFFGMMAGVYHWFPKMFGRMMDHRLGIFTSGLHSWVCTWYSSRCITSVLPDSRAGITHSRTLKVYKRMDRPEYAGKYCRDCNTWPHSLSSCSTSSIVFSVDVWLLPIHGTQLRWSGQHHVIRNTVTGLEKFLQFIAGHMTIASRVQKMILFHSIFHIQKHLSRICRMRMIMIKLEGSSNGSHCYWIAEST
jgi:hypothetical protein